MTDHYSSPDAPAGEETPADQEHNPAEEPAPAAWPQDQPPVDDFADPDPSAEGEATVSQEPEPNAEAAVETGASRKSMFLPVAAGIGGILFLGLVMWWQFGSSPATPSPMIAAAHMPPLPPSLPPPPAPATGPVDLNAIYAGAQPPAAPPLEEVPPATAPGTAPTALDTTPTTSLALPNGAPPSPRPNVTMPPATVAAAAPPSPSSLSPAVFAATDERLTALAARLDGLQRSLDQASARINQIGTAPSANPALEDRLNRIEQKLLQIEHDEENKTAALAVPVEEKSVTHEATSHRKTKTATSRHKTKTHVVKTPARKTTATRWVLRAATPDEAWVSETATSPELRHVEVGDTLPGIGKVNAIRQVGDGWVIEGATGTVR